MILKKLLGEIVHDRYLVTKEQIEEAIKKQREMIKAQMLPERLKRTSLIADARQAMNIDVELLLGKILIDMGYITDEQLDAALKEQDETAQVYDALNSQKLANAMEVGFIVNSTLNLIEVLALIMRHTNLVTNSVASTLMLLDENGDLLFSIPTGPKADKLIDIRIPPGTGIAGWVAVHEQPVLVSNAKEDSRFYPDIDQISGLETQSILCVPLKAKAKLIGVLEVINKADNTFFTNEDYLLLSIFANQAAIAIENARLYGELRDRLAEERQMKQALVEAEKFRALGQMASGVAHDFNNFLSVIMSSAEVAHYDIAENHQARESIDRVLLASRRAKDFSLEDYSDRLIAAILSIAKSAD